LTSLAPKAPKGPVAASELPMALRSPGPAQDSELMPAAGVARSRRPGVCRGCGPADDGKTGGCPAAVTSVVINFRFIALDSRLPFRLVYARWHFL